MLTKEQINEIREHLEKAQNPLFFFDNDNDGLASFLLLQRYVKRGKGIAIRSFPELNVNYYRRVQELKPDYVFILDKPLVSKEFLEKVKQDNIPIVWIDHHQVEPLNDPDIYQYNTYLTNKTTEPVAYLCYQITNNKQDLWLAVIGCISDALVPDFYKEFYEKYPELGLKNPKSAFELLYNSEIGRISRILDFSLKDTITNVVHMQKFMMKAKGPMDVLEENTNTKQIHKQFKTLNSKYQLQIEKARKQKKDKMLYFQYSGQYSLSSNIANQLKYEFPGKAIIVVFIKEDIANLSLRGKDIREITLKAIKDIPGATGGGHEEATGAKMNVAYLPKFKKKIEELIS